MLKALQVVVSPSKAWPQLVLDQPGFLALLLGTCLPVLALGIGVECFALVRWGHPVGELGINALVSESLAWRYALAQLATSLGALFAGSLLIHWICAGFDFPTSIKQCFTLVVFGLSPVWLARALDAIPAMNTWVCWLIGVGGCLRILYQGTGLVLRPDQTKGFGLYLLCALVVVSLSALGHFVGVSVLAGKLFAR